MLQSEGKAWEVGANDTGSITNERSIEQEEENIPHSPSKEEASSFVAGKEEINPAAKKEDNCIVIDDSQSGKSEWPTSWFPSLNMTQSDKAILKSSNAWLSDSIINAAQLKYPNVRDRAQTHWETRHEWALVYRQTIITRGHNTNNIAEAGIRIIKDLVFERIKAYNLVQMFGFITETMELYYQNRLLEIAHSRVSRPLIQKYRTQYNNAINIKCG